MRYKLAVLVFLATLIALTFVSAFDTRMVKWTLCDSMNLTRMDCDEWWEDPSNPYYVGSFDNQDYYNKTEILNLLKQYYNKTEVENLVKSANSTIIDNSTIDNRIVDLTREEVEDEKEIITAVKLKKTIESLGTVGHSTTSSSDLDTGTILFFVFIGVIVIAILIIFGMKKLGQGSQYQIPIKELVPKIQRQNFYAPRIQPAPQTTQDTTQTETKQTKQQ